MAQERARLSGVGKSFETRDGPVTGVIGRKPIHLIKEEDRKQPVELKQLRIDIGARDGEAIEIREL